MNFISRLQLTLLINVGCLVITVLSGKQRVSYIGYEAHRFVPNTEESLQMLKDLHERNPGVIFMKQPGNKGASVDMLFPAHLQTDLLSTLSEKMPSSLLSDDIESMMDTDTHVAQLESLDSGEFPFTTYWNYAKLLDFYRHLESLHPELCKIEQYGQSFEGRPLVAMVVSSHQPAPANKSVMLIDGGMHAREWITVMSCAYFLNELVTNKHQYLKILNSFVVILACCANPDGFTYAWTTNRLWRKTRATDGSALCIGTDPNRNWAFGHGGEGSSTDRCAETYAGKKAFSTPETMHFRDYALTKKVISYCSLHSYSQLVLLSFGCQTDGVTGRYKEFDSDLLLANDAITALHAVHGTPYQAGNSDEILYPACGTSADWFKGIYKCRFAYTYELRDTGTFGFILPADQIEPCGEEVAASLKKLHEGMAAQILKEQKEAAMTF